MLTDTNTLPPVPWKNGGGVTREIAHEKGPKGFTWRLSLADVDVEGPFSIFPGMSRILTVIEGDGLELHRLGQVDTLPRFSPFRFSGETKIDSVLRQGKIRDFNVIYDSDLIAADVVVLTGPTEKHLEAEAGIFYAVLGVGGEFTCDDSAGDNGIVALIQQGMVRLDVPQCSRVLVARLENRKAR